MDKAEFTKWLSIRTGYTFADKTNRDIEGKLDEYAQQVSREKDEKILTLVKQKRALEEELSKRSSAIKPDQSHAS